jgi:hypothetical protein
MAPTGIMRSLRVNPYSNKTNRVTAACEKAERDLAARDIATRQRFENDLLHLLDETIGCAYSTLSLWPASLGYSPKPKED